MALVGIIAAILSTVILQTKKEYAVFLRLGSVIIIFAATLSHLGNKLIEITEIIDVASEYNDLISLMLKGIIISIITSISSDICNESGSVSVGKAIQFAGRVMIMLLSYPLIENIIRTAVSFVGE